MDKMLTIEHVAQTLDVTKPTARRLVVTGEIEGFQVGGRGMWRVSEPDLEAYIEREKAKAKARARASREVPVN